MLYERFWLTRLKFCMSPVKNFNFIIRELLSYIDIKYKRKIYDIILESYIINVINKRYYLIHFKPLKINYIVNLPYKKFRTKFPRFNRNHSYIKYPLLIHI
jgi:hypothetical protein